MMKKTLLTGVAIASILALGSGCSSDDFGGKDGYGRISPKVGVDTEAVTSKNAKGRAQDITANDLSLRLSSADGSFVKTWESLEKFDASEQFPIGAYTFEAFYGDAEAEGFETPAYTGSQELRIADGQTTDVSLTATLAQAMVSIVYTDAFTKYMSDWEANLRTASGETLEYSKFETRPIYIRPGEFTLNVSVTKPNGLGATFEVAKMEAKAKYHYTVTVDLNGGEVGDAVLVVDFDENLNQEEVEIQLADHILSAPAPEISADGFEAATPVEFVGGMASSDPLKMGIIAHGGLAKLTLTTSSISLLSQGWPQEVELISGDNRQTLEDLGLKALGVWNNPDKMAVVDFTEVLSHIQEVSTENLSTFTLVAVDKNSKVSEPLTLSVQLEPLVLELSAQDYYNPGNDLKVALAFNGSNPKENVKIQYKNNNGRWADLEILAAEETGSRATRNYTLTVAAPDGYDSLTIRAVCGNKEGNQITIGTAPFDVTGSENDVYGSFAFVSVTGTEESTDALAARASYFVSTDGKNFTAAQGEKIGNYFRINGLEPNTQYFVRVQIDGYNSKSFQISTTATTPIPGGDMDTWTTAASGNNWILAVPGESTESAVWGTNNPMTTSEGSNFAYCRISGTISTTGRKGGSAALLRTCGWGDGNTAVGTDYNGGACKYTDAGLLHLGSSRSTRPSGYGVNDNVVSCKWMLGFIPITYKTSTGPVMTDDLDCGISFDNRPSALSFWYKYAPKNANDKGYALIWVKDAAGNTLAEGSTLLDKADDFKQAKVDISGQYVPGLEKGAKLYVKFLSSYDMEYIKRQSGNFSGPGNANLSDGTFMGSQLTIDDIELIY